MKKIKTIIFTGGHHNSSLLVAKALQKEGHRIIWLGHRHASSSDINISQEYKDVMAADITFLDLKSGKMYRGNFWQLFKTLISFFYCITLFLKERPSLIVSFGGYLAVPPVIAAWVLRIPSITHEQTMVLGMANKFIIPFVKRIYLTWPIDINANSNKVRVIGLPTQKYDPLIRDMEDLNIFLNKICPKMIFSDPKKPLLVISGGKQGSHFINELIEKCLQDLLPFWNILHQSGSNLGTRDFQKLVRKRLRLSPETQSSYVVVEYMSHFDDVLRLSELVIGRSGAHTIIEILQLGKKMIAIPLPFSYDDEQVKNAQKLVEADLAVILDQKSATPAKLVEIVKDMSNKTINLEKVNNVQNHIPSNALDVLVDDIKNIIE